MDSTVNYNDSFSPSDEDNKFVRKPCRNCQNPTQNRCKRCGDFYCSKKCQTIDWHNHRYICFPMPPLVSKQDLYTDAMLYDKKIDDSANETTTAELKELRMMMKQMMTTIQRIENNNRNNGYSNNSRNDGDTSSSGKSSNYNNFDVSTHNSPDWIYRHRENIKKSQTKEDDGEEEEERKIKMDQITKSKPTDKNDDDCDGQRVIVCGFRSTNRVCILLKSPQNLKAYKNVLDRVNKYAETARPLTKVPEINSHAISTINNQTGRVCILNVVDENKIRVQFLDFGSCIYRKLSELRELSHELAKLPELIQIVQLDGVKLFRYNDRALRYLNCMKNQELIMKKTSKQLVELYDSKSGKKINDEINKFSIDIDNSADSLISDSVSTEKEPDISSTGSLGEDHDEETANSLTKPPFDTHLLAYNSTNMKVVILDTSLVEFGYVACIEKRHMPYLKKVQMFLSELEDTNDPYKPKMGEYIIARYEDGWYRAEVKDILDSGTTFEVSYVDFLNESTLKCKDIRPYPKELKIPCYTTLCLIDGLPKSMSLKQKLFLNKEIQFNDEITIDRVVKLLNKLAVVECSEILNRMLENNLI